MSEPTQFESSRLKIKRAYRHIQEVKSIFHAFLRQISAVWLWRVILVLAISSLKSSLRILRQPSFLAIGDVVHNLRCALDYAAVTILGKSG